MIRKFFRRGASASASTPPAIPTGERVYAIGDVHGCLPQLDALLAQIADDDARRSRANTTIVVLGDVIDRGPASAQVIDRLLALKAESPRTRFLKGNHEEVVLHALDGDDQALRLFCRIGGRETMMSYGVDPLEYDRLSYDELLQRLLAVIPETHRAFLDAFEDMFIVGDYAFVHAGIRPNVELALQKSADLRWIRGAFLDYPARHEKMIVHGHTIAPDVEWRPGRIGIDTGAYSGGPLTALGLDGDSSWVLQAPAGS